MAVRIDRDKLASVLPLSVLPFDIEKVVRNVAVFYDDFLSSALMIPPWTREVFLDGWSMIRAEVAIGDRARGGVLECWTSTTVGSWCAMHFNAYRQFNALLSPIVECRARLTALTQELVTFGLRRDDSNQILFVYDPTTDPINWFTQTVAGGVVQSKDTGVLADTEFHVYTIEATPTLVKFLIDGEVKTEHDLNIPTVNLDPQLYIRNKEAVDKKLQVDYVIIVQER